MSNYNNEEINHLHNYSGRHNPHPQRVTYFTGFLGLPVRVVHDPILTDENILLTQRNNNSSLDLRKRTNLPVGLSPSYYTDYLVNNSLKLNLKNNNISNDTLNKSWKSNYCLHHVPVGILPISLTCRKIPQLDTINGLKYFTGLRNYSVRERPPIIGPLIESEMNYLKELKQSQEYLNERQHINLLNKELSERRMKWQSELGYITGSILSQLQIPIHADDINYDQHSDRLNNSLNRNNSYYLPSSIDEKISIKMNNQISEKMNKNQNVLHESLYSSKTGRLLPPTNDSRYTRTRNQSSSCERRQCLRNATSVSEIFRNYEMQIFAMICSILQTNDMNAVQHWLENATDREKNLIISLVSTALSHQNMYFDTKQSGGNSYRTNTDIHWSRREKLSNNDISLNETVEDENIQNCCTVTDRLVIGEMDNISETHSRGVQANLSCATSEDTLKSNNIEVNKPTNREEFSSLCQTPLKQNWKQHESVGIL
ncbi:hypothetical protein MS3_00002191 [Schistosoma haematobium]|uniref:Protein TBATA n=1 Tax=Schistosoma haematobium TaxID=6185 RepID=A0A094ZMR5_SCHHA|nr:hypothetical protein MS3_00002191 [Schistosoma haematobium]KAH9596544.1 hypothetical protein MS3_00002191 [Schistosoma haematobium]CAH8487660.1 unnamed protein product [Schistosoma haematobium]CAH8488973.1 unnamed protein product [Schistosoma haematobium]